jgi:hypothetical protein
MNITTLAESNHLLDDRLSRLALGNGRLNTVHHNDGSNKVPQHSAAVAGISS